MRATPKRGFSLSGVRDGEAPVAPHGRSIAAFIAALSMPAVV